MTEVKEFCTGYSFTTDTWSSEVSNDCLFSFTVHWLTDLLEKKEAVLHAQPLLGSHSGEVLCREYMAMLTKWNIEKEKVHLIVRGFAHTMQLIIHDGIYSQRAIIDTLVMCRQIVGHFKCSQLAYDYLKIVKDRLQLTKHHLMIKQGVCTRWNITLHMLQVILEQKIALAAYATQYGDVQQFTTTQLEPVGKVVKILGCVEEITKSILTEAASTDTQVFVVM